MVGFSTWYILAHQMVKKLEAYAYTTSYPGPNTKSLIERPKMVKGAPLKSIDLRTEALSSFLIATCFDEIAVIKEVCKEILNNQISTELQPSIYLQSMLNGFNEEIKMNQYAASL